MEKIWFMKSITNNLFSKLAELINTVYEQKTVVRVYLKIQLTLMILVVVREKNLYENKLNELMINLY